MNGDPLYSLFGEEKEEEEDPLASLFEPPKVEPIREVTPKEILPKPEITPAPPEPKRKPVVPPFYKKWMTEEQIKQATPEQLKTIRKTMEKFIPKEEFFEPTGRHLAYLPIKAAESLVRTGRQALSLLGQIIDTTEEEKKLIKEVEKLPPETEIPSVGFRELGLEEAVGKTERTIHKFAEEKLGYDINPYTKAVLQGAGELIGALPGYMGTLKVAAKFGQLMKLTPKLTNVVGLGLHGVLEGIAEEEELGDILKRGGIGALMGSVGIIADKFKPKYLQIIAEGMGFATVDQAAKAIEKGEIPSLKQMLSDPETFSSFFLGGGLRVMGLQRKEKMLKKLPERIESVLLEYKKPSIKDVENLKVVEGVEVKKPPTTLPEEIPEPLALNMKDNAQNSINLKNKLLYKFSTEAKFRQHGAPLTGQEVKAYFGVQDLIMDMGHRFAKRLKKTYKTRDVAADVVLLAEDPRYRESADFKRLFPEQQGWITKAANILRAWFDGRRADYQKRGVDIDFKERMRRTIEELVERAEKPEDRIELEQALEDIKHVEFVHIPVRRWFESNLQRDPLRMSRLLRLNVTQKRKSLSIASLIERGLIDKTQVNPTDIIANYSIRMGRDFALLNIIDAAKREGLATKQVKPGFIDAPREAPALRGYKIHPALRETILDMTRFKPGQNVWDKIVGLTKMAQFINPFFLPMYDIYQGFMAGSFRTIKGAKEIKRGFRDVWKMSKEYQEAKPYFASKPYANPFGSYDRMMDRVKRNPKQMFHDYMKEFSLKKLPKDIVLGIPSKTLSRLYNISWNLAWKLDESVRMVTYRYLRKQGLSVKEAGHLAARFHGDYASVPAPTRKALNRMFFTPTFKIVMGKLYKDMATGAIKSGGKFGKVSKGTSVMGKGLLAWFALNQGWDMFMNSLGFRTDEWGRRYIKDIETDEGPKEFVLILSNPVNLPQKFFFRALKSIKDPAVDNVILDVLKKSKWEITPFPRYLFNALSNKDDKGDPIVNDFDETHTKALKKAWYITKNSIRLLSLFEREASFSDPKAQAQFKKEAGWTLDLLSTLTSQPFKYMRGTEERRILWRIRKLDKQWQRYIKKVEGDFDEGYYKEYLRKKQILLEQLGIEDESKEDDDPLKDLFD